MAKLKVNVKKKRKKTADSLKGKPPGTLIFTGEQRVENIIVNHMIYNQTELKEEILSSTETIAWTKTENSQYIDWFDIRGLHDIKLIQDLGKEFNIHPLVLEDILDVQQRPKYEEYSTGIFISLHSVAFDADELYIEDEAVKLYFGDKFVLSFQEKAEDLFTEVKERVRNGLGRIRRKQDDYLAYALVDIIVDGYYKVIEIFHDQLDELEDQILKENLGDVKMRIHHFKRQAQKLRKVIAPLVEAIGKMYKSPSELIDPPTLDFIRDSYDHAQHVLESTDVLRDRLSNLQDLYMSEMSHQNNEVVKLLTIITTIFVPLAFLTGVYGMNFKHIPELEYVDGYYVLWAVMILMSILLLWYFRRKKWL